MLLRKAQFAGEVLADDVAVPERHRAPAHFQQLHHQHVDDSGLSRAAQAREEHGKSLLAARRIRATQFLDDLREAEPFRNLTSVGQPLAKLRAGNGQRLGALGDFIHRNVRILLRLVNHHLERHHLYAQLFLMLLKKFLSVVRFVERFAAGVATRACMVAADDQMRAAEVLANNRVPDRLPRPAHPHRQRKQAHYRRVLGVVLLDRLVAANACVVVHVARLGHPDDRMDQQVRLQVFRGPEGQFLMRAVHGIACLKGNDLAPTCRFKSFTQVGRSHAGFNEVVVPGHLDALDRSAHIPRVGVIHEMRNGRVLLVGGAEDLLCFSLEVRLP